MALDHDQPHVLRQLYNGQVAPPFGGGVDAVQPGVLSGLHTTAHDGSHAQQWVLDDTPGQLRTCNDPVISCSGVTF